MDIWRVSYMDSAPSGERSSYQATGGSPSQGNLDYQATEQGTVQHDIVTQVRFLEWIAPLFGD